MALVPAGARDRDLLARDITSVHDRVMGLSKDMNEKLAAIKMSLVALERAGSAGVAHEQHRTRCRSTRRTHSAAHLMHQSIRLADRAMCPP